MATTTADLLVQSLIDWGIEIIFGLPGDGINGVFEALRKNEDKIRFVQVRHEEAAAFAACAYAKLTGKVGACIATSGPGGLHLINGLYDAVMDGQPVLAITGNTFHDLIGTRQQQDVDLARLFGQFCVYSAQVNGPAHVENVVDEAMRMALSERGVAHVNIPKGTQLLPVSKEHRSNGNIHGHNAEIFVGSRPLPTQEDLRQAAEILSQGKKVALLVGRGALDARAEVEAVASRLGAPVVKALLGKGVLPDDNPYTTGGIGLLGTRPSVDVFGECDTLLIVGSTFPYIAYYPKPDQAHGVQIDIDPSHIGLRYPVECSLVGDSRDILAALLPMLEQKEDLDFLRKAQKAMQDWRDWMNDLAGNRAVPMKPQVLAKALGQLLADDAIVIADSGTSPSWLTRHWDLHDGQLFTVSGLLASMACGLPYAVGAQVAYPDRQVVAMVGDGALAMLMGDLATLVKYNLPVKVVVLKNNDLGEIRWEQIAMDGVPEFGVELQPIDFVRVAEGFGIRAFTLEDPQAAAGVLRQALEHPGPALVEAVVDSNEPPILPMISREDAANFIKAMVKGQPNRGAIIKAFGEEYLRQVV